ncbi:hypothetical protein [Carboxylicivirga marina]|uniref:Beta-agarase n=1 Tax=Carboxylicivirga marina TaxID=2800988 RepID=A0ABS1HHQ4_9BACT|nr:hypothetical protein [Carboxylicivirga marina]MBK3517087.1 hypothetical protein [Carboxylicivirga marina]
MKSYKTTLIILQLCLSVAISAQTSLIDLSEKYVSDYVKTNNATINFQDDALYISMQANKPLLELHSPSKSWDLRSYSSVAFEVTNLGDEPILLNAHISDYQWNEGVLALNSGETSTMRILIKGYRLPEKHPLARSYEGMFGYPGGYYWHWVPTDVQHIDKIKLSLINPRYPANIAIKNIVAEGNLVEKSYEEIQKTVFPFVDTYGQYMHKEWQGKVHSDVELKKAVDKEKLDLISNPSPKDRNKYGGWTLGKKYKSTGHFRVEKINGRWWMIDPEGYLFWSHGITGVAKAAATTKVVGREKYFSSLPDKEASLFQFAKPNKAKILTYNFTGANLYRKYGSDWERIKSEMAHTRLRSWGMNTFGNWSDETTYLQRKTPYTVSVNFRWKRIGCKLKFPNVFDPSYKANLEKTFEKHKATWEDDFCIGYFVDNELHGWGKIGRAVQTSSATDNAKVELLSFLSKKYASIEKLNAAWESEYVSWKAFLNSTKAATGKTAGSDLLAFEKIMVELYYKTCRDVIKAKAPNKLYMGSRLHNHYYPDDLGHQRWIVPIAAKYCDIVSFNRYRFVPNNMVFHDKSIDKPIIIGEFHFGALDRGMLHTGLRSVQNQEQRGRVYYEYIKGALENPYIVGAHWFQYGEQAVTGRGDGENYQIGFLDVCDTPYQETIDASRKVGEQMYELRLYHESINTKKLKMKLNNQDQ